MNKFQLTTNPFDSHEDRMHEECGVFGIINHADAAAHTALGLHALQHRGQEGAGIVSCDEEGILHSHLAFGKVGENFNGHDVIDRLKGQMAIGHNRYSTSGAKTVNNLQPLFAELRYGPVALAHNGNLTNPLSLKEELVEKGCIFRSSMDTEVVMHLIAISTQDKFTDALSDALARVEGAYSMVVMWNHKLVGVRDPRGVRPLILGELDGSHILVSESCALDIIGASYVRDIAPGEMVVVSANGDIESSFPFEKKPSKFCIFEYVYFSRPDSQFEGKDIYELRKNMGRELAKIKDYNADVVVPVPDSGVAAAIGFSEEAGIPMDLGIIRNHYVGRTFIEPTDSIRHLGVKLKHNANKRLLAGKRVVLIDDSIVRGTTSKKIVDMVRSAGAKEVHMRISSPPTSGACFYGIDTPESEKLLANKMSVAEMCEYIQADSLGFITPDALYRAVGETQGRNNEQPQYCDACFTGDYSIPLADKDRYNKVA